MSHAITFLFPLTTNKFLVMATKEGCVSYCYHGWISKTTNKSWWYVTSFKLLRKWAKVSVLLLKVSSLLSVSFTKRIPCSCCYSDIGDDNAKHAKKRSYYSVYNAEYSTTFRQYSTPFFREYIYNTLGCCLF